MIHVAPETPKNQIGPALADAIERAGVRREDVGEKVGVSAAMVSLWITGRNGVRPQQVFALEETLGLEPGELSRLEGYLPAESTPAPTPEAAIQADSSLTADQKKVLRGMLREMRRVG